MQTWRYRIPYTLQSIARADNGKVPVTTIVLFRYRTAFILKSFHQCLPKRHRGAMAQAEIFGDAADDAPVVPSIFGVAPTLNLGASRV